MNDIVQIPLDPISPMIKQKARLHCATLPDEEKAAMIARCHEMNETAKRHTGHASHIRLRVPKHVLAVPLSARQRRTVDELATGEIADICVAAQAEIAQIPIRESREPLVNLRTYASRLGVVMTFSNAPYPDVSGPSFAGKPQLFWARQSFAERLMLMAHILASLGIVLHIEEAFRPHEVQAGMFRRRLARTRSEHPSWTDEQVIAEARSKTASTPRLSWLLPPPMSSEATRAKASTGQAATMPRASKKKYLDMSTRNMSCQNSARMPNVAPVMRNVRA